MRFLNFAMPAVLMLTLAACAYPNATVPYNVSGPSYGSSAGYSPSSYGRYGYPYNYRHSYGNRHSRRYGGHYGSRSSYGFGYRRYH